MSGVPFDPAMVRELATILVETGLTEIEVTEKDSRIRVVRAPAPVMAAGSHAPVAAVSAAAPAIAAVPGPEIDDAAHPGMITSPMVGVVYLAPEPGATPFVAVGQPVAAGQTVALIEAMKTFNQIKAPNAGIVARILVTAGAPVEYGEPLMIIT